MFSIVEINNIHDRIGKRSSLAAYLSALKAIGVDKYDTFITDGHSEYFGSQHHPALSPPTHEPLAIAPICSSENFFMQLKQHEQGHTTYIEMCKGLAEAGIEKWTFDTNKMSIAYYDKMGNEILTEKIT